MFSFPEALQLGMKRIDQMESEKVSLEGQISQRTVKVMYSVAQDSEISMKYQISSKMFYCGETLRFRSWLTLTIFIILLCYDG